MFKVSIIAWLFASAIVTPIYSINVHSAEGGLVNFAEFQGKKILIVNIASNSIYAPQLRNLELLQQKYQDSLIVIGIPSNSFGKEPGEAIEVQNRLKDEYNLTFRITEKMKVKEVDKSPLYKWLTEENGIMAKDVAGDFHKYLISSKGTMIGYFVGSVDPMDSLMIRAIEGIPYAR